MRSALLRVGLVALLVLSGCQLAPKSDAGVQAVNISGLRGDRPTISFTTGHTISKSTVRVIEEGGGPKAARGDTIVADVYSRSLKDGNVVLDTFLDRPRTYVLDPTILGQEMYEALVDKPTNSRIVLESAREQLVAVFDTAAFTANGSEEALPPDFGLKVSAAGKAAPAVSVTGPMPTTFQSAPVIRGLGEQVTARQLVTLQVIGVDASTGQVIESTWEKNLQPYSAVLGKDMIPGWALAIEGQRIGSRVVAVIPPQQALHDGRTLVFVIDILHARRAQ